MSADPFERGDESIYKDTGHRARPHAVGRRPAIVAQWLQSFKEFPIRQKPASFNLDEVMRKLSPSQ